MATPAEEWLGDSIDFFPNLRCFYFLWECLLSPEGGDCAGLFLVSTAMPILGAWYTLSA